MTSSGSFSGGDPAVRHGATGVAMTVDEALAALPRVLDALTGAEWWRQSDAQVAATIQACHRAESRIVATQVEAVGEGLRRGLPVAAGCRSGAAWLRSLVPLTPRSGPVTCRPAQPASSCARWPRSTRSPLPTADPRWTRRPARRSRSRCSTRPPGSTRASWRRPGCGCGTGWTPRRPIGWPGTRTRSGPRATPGWSRRPRAGGTCARCWRPWPERWSGRPSTSSRHRGPRPTAPPTRGAHASAPPTPSRRWPSSPWPLARGSRVPCPAGAARRPGCC